MAQQNVVPSLFGITPELYQQNRMDELQAQQMAAGRMAAGPGSMLNPSLAPLYAQAAQRGQLVGEAARAVGGLLGVEDPQLVKIRDVQQMRNQFDVSTPDGLRSFAQALSAKGYGDLALQAATEADRRTKLGAEAQMSQQKIDQEKKLREELAKLGDNPTEEQYLRVFRQFGTPDQQSRVIEANITRRQKIAADEAGGAGPGAVGKSGAWRDVYGAIIPPAVMKDVHKEFKAAQNLYDTLSQVNEQDIKNAESLVDWTTKSSETKALAKSATLKAQTKLAASQLMEQIGQLPPGSASDADMRASMKTFPGYSDPDALAAWVNETKRKLERTINLGATQYGFTPNVKITGPIDLTKKKTSSIATPASAEADALVNKYLTPPTPSR